MASEVPNETVAVTGIPSSTSIPFPGPTRVSSEQETSMKRLANKLNMFLPECIIIFYFLFINYGCIANTGLIECNFVLFDRINFMQLISKYRITINTYR